MLQLKTLTNELPVDPKVSKLPIKIIGDRAIVKYISPGEYLAKGILRPVDYVDPYAKGEIMTLGGGEYGTSIPESLEAGHFVNYWHQSAIDFEINGEKYHLIRVSDIFMLL